MGFQFSAPVKRFVDANLSGKPTFKATTTQNKFQLSPSAMALIGAKRGSYVNILHNPEAESMNEAFALCITDSKLFGHMISIPKNSHRGEFSFSGRYGMIIGMNSQIDYSPTELVEMGIMTRTVRPKENGEGENVRYSANYSVVADVAEGVETQIDEETYMVYPLVNFTKVDKQVRDEDDLDIDREFVDLDEEAETTTDFDVL